MSESLTVEILREIRDEVREHSAQLRSLNGRIDTLEKRQLSTEIRLATGLTAVVGAIHELKDVLIEDRRLRRDVEDHERRITALEGKSRA